MCTAAYLQLAIDGVRSGRNVFGHGSISPARKTTLSHVSRCFLVATQICMAANRRQDTNGVARLELRPKMAKCIRPWEEGLKDEADMKQACR